MLSAGPVAISKSVLLLRVMSGAKVLLTEVCVDVCVLCYH